MENKELYTASFAKVNVLDGYTKFPISDGIPKWFTEGTKYVRYKKLAPPHELVDTLKSINGNWDKETSEMFAVSFATEVLQKLSQEEVYKELSELSGGKPIVLMTQEKHDEFGTRFLVKTWFEMAGIKCTEVL